MQTQIQTQIPANEAPAQAIAPVAQASAKPAGKGRTERKANKGKGKATQAPATPVLGFYLQDYARPSAGSRLYAHTAAAMALLGISEAKPIPRATLVKVLGPTAVKYHLGNVNFEATEEGVRLTNKGTDFFAARRAADPELVKGYTQILSTGKADGSLVKADGAIKAIGA